MLNKISAGHGFLPRLDHRRHDSHRQGYGRVIVQDLIERGHSSGYHTILAASCEESVGSIRLLESLGFKETGRMQEVGSKFGRRLAVVYLQLMLASS